MDSYIHQFKGVPKPDSKKLMKLVALRGYDGKPAGTMIIQCLTNGSASEASRKLLILLSAKSCQDVFC